MKKKKLFIILIIFLIVLIISGSSLYLYLDYININYKKEIAINVGNKIPTIKNYVSKKDYKKIKNDIKWNKMKIENKKIYHFGTYNGTFIFNKKRYQVKLIVKDNIAPEVTEIKNLEIYTNDKIDLLSNAKVSDNSHDIIKKEIKGKYDITKKGTYNLTFVATDKAKNVTKKDFKLIVKEKEIVKPTPNTDYNNHVSANYNSSKGYKIEKINGIYYIDGILIANKSYALPSTYNPGGLLSQFTSNFNILQRDAKNTGINLNIISGFRSYDTQAVIYNRYVNSDGQANADTYSARPGHSEHQSGLAADINSLDQNWIYTNEGKWLNNNCYKYGFIIRYPKGKEAITGYIYEPWHIRYVGTDLATKLYNNGNWITLEEYFGITSHY